MPARPTVQKFASPCAWFGMITAVLLTPLCPDALAQPDPFRASAPRPPRQAPRPTPPALPAQSALETRPVTSPPAGYVWAFDLRTDCRVALRDDLAPSPVRWSGRCVDQLADGPGMLTVITNERSIWCYVTIQAGRAPSGPCG